MAVIYDNTIKAARLTATRDELASGTLELLSASDAVLAIFTLSVNGGTVSTDTWTLEFTSTSTTGETAASTGTNATKAQIKDSGGVARLTGLTVGLSASDIIVDNQSIAEGQTVTLSGAQTIQHAA